MSKVDSMLASIERIGATQPVYDVDGEGNTSIIAGPSKSASKAKLEAVKQEPSEQYQDIFSKIDEIAGESMLNEGDIAKNKAKKLFLEVAEMMDSRNVQYWNKDKSILEACAKLKPVLEKIANRL